MSWTKISKFAKICITVFLQHIKFFSPQTLLFKSLFFNLLLFLQTQVVDDETQIKNAWTVRTPVHIVRNNEHTQIILEELNNYLDFFTQYIIKFLNSFHSFAYFRVQIFVLIISCCGTIVTACQFRIFILKNSGTFNVPFGIFCLKKSFLDYNIKIKRLQKNLLMSCTKLLCLYLQGVTSWQWCFVFY